MPRRSGLLHHNWRAGPDPPKNIYSDVGIARLADIALAAANEAAVRFAMSRGDKILIGRRRIVLPSAGDLGVAHNVLTEKEGS